MQYEGTLADRAVAALRRLRADGALTDRYMSDVKRNADIGKIIDEYADKGDGIRRTTIVEGWTHAMRPGGKKVYEGHIDLLEAINLAGDKLLNDPGVYIKAYHHVELAEPVKWQGNVPSNEAA